MENNINLKPAKTWKKVLKVILIILLVLILFVAAVLVTLTIREYKPDETEILEITDDSDMDRELKTGDELTVMTWNVGYGALGDNADFFMDGGKSIYSSQKDRVVENLDAISKEIKGINPDIALLQEVDIDSSRSFHIDESDYLLNENTGYYSTYATNFKVDYIPLPVPPMGKMYAGIQTLSVYEIDNAERQQLPCPFSWPLSTINLKRCLAVNRIPVADSDKELVVVNLHLEAYDSGEGKIKQTAQLRELLEKEAEKGNYVIAGGDFNQTFSSINNPYPEIEGMWHAGKIEVSDFSDMLSFHMDDSCPSCRSLDKAYEGADHDNFQYYIIDGFIVSDNVEIKSFGTRDLDFKNTDHNPVVMEIKLK